MPERKHRVDFKTRCRWRRSARPTLRWLERLWFLTIEKPPSISKTCSEAAVGPLDAGEDVAPDIVGERVEHPLLRKATEELGISKDVDRPVILFTIAPPQRLGHPLPEARRREWCVPQVSRDELFEVAGGHRYLRKDFDPTGIAREVHSVVAPGGDQVSVWLCREWLVCAIVCLEHAHPARQRTQSQGELEGFSSIAAGTRDQSRMARPAYHE
jgi:hypothetical protein